MPVPPYVYWQEFRRAFSRWWRPGEHLALVGKTGSGKTVLTRSLLSIRDYVVVFGTKPRDASLYEPLERQGFEITDRFNPEETDRPKLIFRPPLGDLSREGRAAQREAFRAALDGIYRVGSWCVVLDEVRYLSEQLRLVEELNLLWLQGRSLGISIVAGTQRPVSVPLNMFEMATHHFAFRMPGRDDRARASDYLGDLREVAFQTMAELPRHEFLYADVTSSRALRSRVEK